MNPNRDPPKLLYISIYNPTLRATGPVDGDEDDAEEQAQIIFYTSREKAVSRDRMLRQIGLAKALVNFSELFNATEPCEAVHSQSKRMVMISPEPNFWIHACIELARVPKPGSSKVKSKSKGADKGKDKATTIPAYDFEESSVYDAAVRSHIMRGYERFKLTHGSFTSILSKLGQTALELQLERFWTVWAWSWDMEEPPCFGEDFGPPLHPHCIPLGSAIDEFAQSLSQDLIPVALSAPFVIPSTLYTEAHYPSSLAAHLLSMIPPPRLHSSRSSDTINNLASSVDTIRAKGSNGKNTSNDDSGTFLGMPAMKIDMGKWNWPGYLTFGRGSGGKDNQSNEKAQGKPPENEKSDASTSTAKVNPPVEEETHVEVEVEVNPEALEDALSSDSLSLASQDRSQSLVPQAEASKLVDGHSASFGTTTLHANKPASLKRASPSPPPTPPAEFSLTRAYLAPSRDSTATTRVSIHYFIKGQLMLALVQRPDSGDEGTEAEESDLEMAAAGVSDLFRHIQSIITAQDLQSQTDSLPTAVKILQPQDRYTISTGRYSYSTPNFVSNSSHLFNAKSILDADPDIQEVFSRGQNPQHWHIGKRPTPTTNAPAGGDLGHESEEKQVYLEVFRKETSLTDVDNILAGIVKKTSGGGSTSSA